MKLTKSPFIILPIIFIFLSSFGFFNETFEKIIARLDYMIYNFPQEKVYVATDKPHYIIGDTIWLSVWATDATFTYKNPVSNLVYVQLLDDESNIKQRLKIPIQEKNGRGFIAIDGDYKDGSYSLQAYTSYMLNYDENLIFSREIQIWALNSKQEEQTKANQNNPWKISFYPEGGNLVNGFESTIAFEVLDNHGNAVEKEFKILDQNNQTISQAKTLYDGMGIFTLKPQQGQKYFAEIDNKSIELPAALPEGFVLKVNNRSKDFISVNIQTNNTPGLEDCFLICHTRGEVFFTQKELKGQTMTIKVDKAEINSGVAQITLFNKNGKPVAERSIFVKNDLDDINVKFNMDFAYFNPRDKAEIDCKLTDKFGSSVNGAYTVSIFDAKEVNYSPYDLDIYSYLLLQSELTKTIRNPGFYFQDFGTQKATLLDIAMMVHSWTRIKSEGLIDVMDPSLRYGPERGLTISGEVKQDGRGVFNATVDMIIMEGGGYMAQAKTNKKGEFAFYDVPAFKGHTITLQAFKETKKGKKSNKDEKVILSIDERSELQILAGHSSKIALNKEFNKHEFLMTSLEKNRTDSLYADMYVQLDEVTVKVKKENIDKKLNEARNIIYPKPDTRIIFDSLKQFNPGWSIFEFVAYNTPGAQLVGRERGEPTIRFRGGLNSLNEQRPAVFYLDGTPISTQAASNINVNTVEFIDVLRGLTKTVLYGDEGMGGIIHIYTKLGTSGQNKRKGKDNLAQLIAEGFHEPREFYSPIHDGKSKMSGRPDIRTTLYWNPYNRVDDDGKSKLKFYTCDKKSTYKVLVQGITLDGRPFVGTYNFDVKDPS